MNTTVPAGRTAEILLVEDSDADATLAREGLRGYSIPVNLHHVPTGELALAFLRRQPPFVDAPAPQLVLLDLNMPAMNGRELLAEILADANLRHLPVIILSNAQSESVALEIYRMRANTYIRKPIDFDQFELVIRGIVDYWFRLAELPKARK